MDLDFIKGQYFDFNKTTKQEIEEIEKHLVSLTFLNEKIDYLIDKKHEYLKRITSNPEQLFTSGIISKELGNKEHGLDAWIQTTINHYEEKLKREKPIKKKNEPSKIAIGMFCSLIHLTGIDRRNEAKETREEDYCKRICNNYGLVYSDNVRQNFNYSIKLYKSDSHLHQLQTLILPKIPPLEKEKIEAYINEKAS